MKKLSLEMIVGVFMIVGIACLGWISIKLGKNEVMGSNYYTVYADFQSLTGLRQNAEIEIAGVIVGSVKRIFLHKNLARAELHLNKGLQLPDDTIVSVKTRGLIGDKVVSISLGGSPDIIKPGEVLRETESSIDLEHLISQYIFGKV